MTMSLKRQVTLRHAMAYAGDMAERTPKPECYRWKAKWWRLHARESKNPGECLQYADNQMALYRDMLARPAHYTDIRRPAGTSDWQWSGLSHNAGGNATERSEGRVDHNVGRQTPGED